MSRVNASACSTKSGEIVGWYFGGCVRQVSYSTRSSLSASLSSFTSSILFAVESISSSLSFLDSSANLFVSKANLMVAATMSNEGDHLERMPFFVSPDQPPKAKDKSPHLLDLLASLCMFCLWSSHSGHPNKKWSTDSDSCTSHLLSHRFLLDIY